MEPNTFNKQEILDEIYGIITAKRKTSVTDEQRELLGRAYDTAYLAHIEQKRKSGEPYFVHIVATAKNAALIGMGATTVAAAFLHDTIEDTDYTAAQMINDFGSEITSLVEGVTKLGKLKYRERERHVESLRKFFLASARDLRVIMIKLADRLHNLSTLNHVSPEKQKRIALESIEIYAPLAGRLGMGKLSGQIQDTAFPFAYPDEYKKLFPVFKKRTKEDEKLIEKVFRSLKVELAKSGIKENSVTYRIKGLFSLFKKMSRKNSLIEEIHDIVALRVLVHNIGDCYQALGIIHSLFKPVPNRIKDYIAVPKPNGYQSLHTTIFTGEGHIVEIQIRTFDMHEFAEYGVAAHVGYKQGTLAVNVQKQKYHATAWMEDLKDYNKESDDPDEFFKHLKNDFFEDRIFVFTPMGDVIDLPVESSVLDFAFAIHSDIGMHASGAYLNNKFVALKTSVHNHDIVRIETDPKIKPSEKWMDWVRTSFAKRVIRAHLKNTNVFKKWFVN